MLHVILPLPPYIIDVYFCTLIGYYFFAVTFNGHNGACSNYAVPSTLDDELKIKYTTLMMFIVMVTLLPPHPAPVSALLSYFELNNYHFGLINSI